VSSELNVLCAGAVQGLAKALEPAFVQASGATLNARYGAVGALKEALEQGAPIARGRSENELHASGLRESRLEWRYSLHCSAANFSCRAIAAELSSGICSPFSFSVKLGGLFFKRSSKARCWLQSCARLAASASCLLSALLGL